MSASLHVPGQADSTRSPTLLPSPSRRYHQHVVSAFSFSSEEDDDMPLDDEPDSEMDATYRYSITAALAAATQDSLNDSPSVPGEDLPIRRTSRIHLSNSNHEPFRLQSPKKHWQRHRPSHPSINSRSFLHLEQDSEYGLLALVPAPAVQSELSADQLLRLNSNGPPSEPLSPRSQPKSDPPSATIPEIPTIAPRFAFPAPPGFHKPIFSPLTDNQWVDSLQPSPGPYSDGSPWSGAVFDDDYECSPRNSRFPAHGRPSSLTLDGTHPNAIFAALGNHETGPEQAMDDVPAPRRPALAMAGVARPATVYHTPPQSNSQSNSQGNSHQNSPRSQTPSPRSHSVHQASASRAEVENASDAADEPHSPASTASPTETKVDSATAANDTDGEDRATTPTPARRRRCVSMLSPAHRARVGISIHKGEGLLEWARPLLEMDLNGKDRRSSVSKLAGPSMRMSETSKRAKRASAFI
ncbi:hypothetical protein IWX90DRAFT_489066 [Phyllosticta citrichinensis]|uniref:Uncharacterized protein n=1 Tax=Phyllosticta citrichinensis TaxID=1130410 RepID=A0ABR1XLC7_9PEZI